MKATRLTASSGVPAHDGSRNDLIIRGALAEPSNVSRDNPFNQLSSNPFNPGTSATTNSARYYRVTAHRERERGRRTVVGTSVFSRKRKRVYTHAYKPHTHTSILPERYTLRLYIHTANTRRRDGALSARAWGSLLQDFRVYCYPTGAEIGVQTRNFGLFRL